MFQIVFGAAAIPAGIFLWPLGILFGALFVYATWLRARRTVVDRSRTAFQVRPALRRGSLEAGQPIETLRVVRRVKTSKGTTTVTYEIVSGERTVADGLPAKSAAALADELCDFLGRPRVDVPE